MMQMNFLPPDSDGKLTPMMLKEHSLTTPGLLNQQIDFAEHNLNHTNIALDSVHQISNNQNAHFNYEESPLLERQYIRSK